METGTRESSDVALVGAGKAGTALGVLLARAGYRVVAACGGRASQARVRRYLPDTEFVSAGPAETARRGEVVVFAVPDDVLASLCRRAADDGGFHHRQHVLHLSGALGLDVLDPARLAGADVLSVHPLQSFPDVDRGIERLPGSAVAITARTPAAAAVGERLARDVGGVPFAMDEEAKPLYHAAAVFASNYLVTVEGLAERLFDLAGVSEARSLFAPLARASLEAALADGAGAALTGPASRGDVGTIQRNLSALRENAPEVVAAYVVLARAAAAIASEAGRLSSGGREAVEEVLGRWR